MSRESRMFGGILFVVFPTVIYGGLSLLSFLTRSLPGYAYNPLRHDLWRAGHAHAGVYLVLSPFLYCSFALDWLARVCTDCAELTLISE